MEKSNKKYYVARFLLLILVFKNENNRKIRF